jgi:hypothetical protein
MFVKHTLRWIYFHNELFGGSGISSSVLLAAIQKSTEQGDETNDRHYDIDTLRELCGCLISVDIAPHFDEREINRVSLAHYTVQEYLQSPRISTSLAAGFAMDTILIKQDFSRIAMLETLNLNSKIDKYYQNNLAELGNDLENYFDTYCIALAIQSCLKSQEIICGLDELFGLTKQFLDPSAPHFRAIRHILGEIGEFSEVLGDADWPSEHSFLHLHWHSFAFEPDAMILTQILHVFCFNDNLLIKKFLEEGDVNKILSSELEFTKIFWFFSEDNMVRNFEFRGTIIEALALGILKGQENLRLMLEYGAGLFDPSEVLVLFTGSHDHESEDGSCLVEQLLRAGANPNGKTYRTTPLQIAVVLGDYGGVKLLLESGADPNSTGHPEGIVWGEKSYLNQFNNFYGHSPLYLLRNYIRHPIPFLEEVNITPIDMLLSQAGGKEFQNNGAPFD